MGTLNYRCRPGMDEAKRDGWDTMSPWSICLV